MTFGLSLGILFSVFSITQVLASSHREAPLISNDPLADNTDVYAFRSPDDPNTVTIIANYIPMQLPHGGPNYYTFGENIRYEIHIDNDASTPGDDITYRFTFNKVNEDPTTFFNIRLGAQNQKNTYTMEKSTDGGQTFTTVVENGVVPPYNVGDRSIGGAAGLNTTYEDLFNSAITSIGDGESVFCGHIEDPFFVDLGGIFDLGDAPRQNGTPRDGLACMNVSTIALKINISDLQKDGLSVDQAANILDGDFVIGVWASASRQQIRTLNTDGTETTDGDWVQVSRLGMPLTNEAVIAVGDKDYWNSITPYEDLANIADFGNYFYNPELALYMDEDNFAGAVPAFGPLRIQRNSLQSFDFGNGQDGLFPLKGTPALDGTVLASDSPYEDLLLPAAGSPRSVDLWPIFHTGVPNARPYQLATGKEGDPLAAGKPFINNFLPNGGDMLRLNMATPVTQRDDPAFSSLGLVQAAVLGLTDPAYANTDIQFIPNMDGFPNGRRLEDDVTRIELQAVAGVVLDAIGLWEDDFNPNEDDSPVTDQLLAELSYSTGVDANDAPFRSTFPYVQLPFSGTSACSGKAIEYEQPAVLEPTPIVAPVCDNFSYFLSDHSAEDGISDIYKVNIVDGNAELEYIATSDIEVHIAYNSMDNLIYAVSKFQNSYRTLDPTTGAFGPTVDLGGNYGEITAAVINAEGKLLIGSQNNNAIYSVNLSTNEVTIYDSFSPVTGGDLAFSSDGMLYLATRTGTGLYENYPEGDMPDQLIGSVSNLVTGLAITDLDNLLVSAHGNTSLEVRGTDGTDPHVSYPVMLNGEPYTLRDGDMASGCNTGSPLEGQCDSFTTWYVNHGAGISGSDMYTVVFTTGGFANLSYVTNVDFEAHIAFNAIENVTYFVNADGSEIRIYDVTTNTFLVDIPLSGADFSKITAVIYNPADNKLYIGDDILNAIYAVDVTTGAGTYYASAPVSGGDLSILADGSLYLATRTGNSLYKIVESGDPELVNTIPELVTGMARGNDATSLFLSNNGSTEFTQIMASDGSPMATYTAMLGGSVFTLNNGDMAAGCADAGLLEEGCYGDSVLEFVQGPKTNGSAVPAGRSDAAQALGEPDRSNATGGFVSLGVGGHITIGFAGVVDDADGNDIRIFETSYSGDECGASDDESADFELSADGVNFVSVGSLCRDGEIDMADAGLSSVTAIRITNSPSTNSPDGYDVDGVEAINGCSNAIDDGMEAVEAQSMLTSYPNPTSGASEVVFHIANESKTTVEVFDMNGRKVASLFDEVAKSDQEYRLNFNGSDLPNGVYVYRLTTDHETIINKFMIAK